jgi:hypothetical protein
MWTWARACLVYRASNHPTSGHQNTQQTAKTASANPVGNQNGTGLLNQAVKGPWFRPDESQRAVAPNLLVADQAAAEAA